MLDSNISEEGKCLLEYLSGTSASRKTLCGLYAGFSLSSLIFIISISQNLTAFQSNGIILLLMSGFFLFIIASRIFYKIEEICYRIKMNEKIPREIYQDLSELDRRNKKASKLLSVGQFILLLCSIFFGFAVILPFWIDI